MTKSPTVEELQKAVSDVCGILASQNQYELGWMFSCTRNIRGYEGRPKENAQIQARLDNAVGGVSVVYIFALLESYIPRSVWQYAEDEHRDRMYAYLHIRNTCAHGFDGARADRYKDKFDTVMASDKPILHIERYDANAIIVQPSVWQPLKDFIPTFLGSILQKVINYGY